MAYPRLKEPQPQPHKPPEIVPLETPPPKPTDDELGDRLIERWNGNRAFFYGTWHRYENGVWQQAPRVTLDIWELMKTAKVLGIRPTSSKATSIEKYVELVCLVESERINQSMNYINLRNGLFNLETGELEPHRKDLFMTSQLPFDYDPDADCPTWLNFLNDVLVYPDSNRPDRQLQMVVREAFGYSLTEDTQHRVSFWLVGPSGTGKSTLLDVLIALAGDSHVTVDLDELGRNTYQLADIAGRRVVTFTEPDSRGVLADGQYKRLVSRDVVTARQIFGQPFRFVPVCKVWGAMNQTPRVVDRSDAIYGRVMIIPMNRVIPREQWDTALTEKLRAELPGIFNWALIGLRRLRNGGKFDYSEQIELARAEYRAENDIEAAFVDEWCETGDRYSIPAAQLYQAYSRWCRENGAQPKSSVKVARDWQRMGFNKKRLKQGNVYYGVQLNDAAPKMLD